MDVWLCSAGPKHFLLSDDIDHLCSGWHHDGGGNTHPWQPNKAQAIEDDKLLLMFVDEYLKRC